MTRPAVVDSGMDESTTGRHIPALDGLRGTAILMVLFLHLFAANNNPQGGVLVRFFAQFRLVCWVGVDLFFVLSGFLLTGILYDTLQSKHFFRNFYGRRALRIFPLYYGFFLVIIPLAYAAGYPWARGIFAYLTYTVSLLPFGVSYCEAPWLNINHFWTLAIEEQFYVVWPLAIFFLRTKRRIVTAALLGVAGSFLVRLWLESSGHAASQAYLVYSWTPARLDSLLLGAVLAMLIRSSRRAKVIRTAPWLLLAGAVLLCGYTIYRGNFDPMTDSLVATVGLTLLGCTFTALVAVSLRSASLASTVFSSSILRFFGRYSYGLYVYHYTLKAAFDHFLHPLLESQIHSKLALLALSGSTVAVASVVLAYVSFHGFEKPFLLLKRYFTDDTSTPKLRQDVREASTP